MHLFFCAVVRRAQRPRAGIDVRGEAPEDGLMGSLTFATPRRSGRMFLRMRVQAAGKSNTGRKFREISETVVVSAHGCLLYLEHEVGNGTILVLTNPVTQEDQECRVVYLGEAVNRGQRVGVEFLTPAPHFWGVDFDAPQGSETVH